MIVNKTALLRAAPIKDMLDHKVQASPTSYGLTECGYDIRIKQDILFCNRTVYTVDGIQNRTVALVDGGIQGYRFVLASSMEEFQLPNNLMGQLLNKSTWARLGLDASMTTNLEPGWSGYLTLELTYHGRGNLHIPAGSGIAQVMFHHIMEPAQYVGKYQNQADKPVSAITGLDPDGLKLNNFD